MKALNLKILSNIPKCSFSAFVWMIASSQTCLAASVLPIQFLGYNTEVHTQQSRVWERIQLNTAKELFDQKTPINLSNFTKDLVLPLVLQSGAKPILWSQIPLQNNISTNPQEPEIIYAPFFCRIKNRDTLMLNAVLADTDELLVTDHRVLDTNIFDYSAEKTKLDEQLLQKTFQDLAQALKNKITLKNSAIRLGIKLHEENTRKDQGSNLCLQNLLSEKLLDRGRIITPLFLEQNAMIRTIHALAQKKLDSDYANSPKLRINRTLNLIWNLQANTDQINLSVTAQESVFAQRIGLSTTTRDNPSKLRSEENIKITLDQNRWRLSDVNNIANFLTQQTALLDPTQGPRIRRIDRAWAYVDKGRAWGLKINDRLVSKDSAQNIEGHVVGFFGPDLNLKTADGTAIPEGAIVYLRKSQRKASPGTELAYDPKTFPQPRKK